MLRVYACITEDHDLRLVLVAGLVCALASFTAFSLYQRALAAGRSAARLRWLVTAAIVTGAGVWSTHFVAMLAFMPSMPIGYDPGLTVLSILIAMVVSGIGLGIALYRARLALLGGAVVGIAVASMHYVGMSAMRVQAEIDWSAAYVAASLVVSVALGALALRTNAKSTAMRQRLLAALILTLGICGLHFTAMAAATLEPDVAPLPLPEGLVEPGALAIAIAAVTIIIIGLGFVSSIVGRRAGSAPA